MIIETYEIIRNPTKFHLYQIYKWLKQELAFGNFFFYNFITIKAQLKNEKGFCLLVNNEVVGFMTYSKYGFYAQIEIANIKHEYKRKGLGTKLLEYVQKHLIQEGVVVLELFCSPLDSKPIWQKLGFSEFEYKDIISKQNKKIYLYKIIVEYLAPQINVDIKYSSYLEISGKTWQIRKLIFDKPIIYITEPNTTIKCIINDELIYKGTTKKFRNYYTGNYLIIKSLKNDIYNSSNNSTFDKFSN